MCDKNTQLRSTDFKPSDFTLGHHYYLRATETGNMITSIVYVHTEAHAHIHIHKYTHVLSIYLCRAVQCGPDSMGF